MGEELTVHIFHLGPSCHLGLDPESVVLNLEDTGVDLPTPKYPYPLPVFAEPLRESLPLLSSNSR